MNTEFLAGSKAKVTFDVTPEQFENALNAAFEQEVKNVSIPGFRKGHISRAQFEKHFGVESLYNTALDVLFNGFYQEILANKELAHRVISQPMPGVESKIERGTAFKVSLSFDVYPEPELPAYKGLEVAKKNTTVTDEEVNESINSLLKAQGKLNEKAEQVIAKGDTANFDFEGSVDGKVFDGGSAKGYEMEIGSGQFIPGFEDQMIGMKAGETKDVNVTFPTPYAAKELEGKAAVFKVTVNSVKEMTTPELNDEFVASLKRENISTVEELKASTRKNLEESKEESEKNRQIDDLVNQILDNTKVELPESLVNSYVESYKSRYVEQAKAYNIPLETLLQLSGTDMATFEETAKNNGQRQALFQVVLDKVVRDEKLEPSTEEFDAKLVEIATATKQKKEEVARTRGQQIYGQLIYEKFINLVVSSAKEI
ncbi:MAG: trigger factor [Acholeplasmatales bacterium]|nr:trigger factor [Acholeplasmatales bacterium]